MSQTATLSNSSNVSKFAPQISIGLSGLFLLILFSMHFLEPEFDPSWRMISEYELGSYGWMMRLAFFCWGGSVLAMLLALWPWLKDKSGLLVRGWLLVMIVALFGAGIFITDPITALTDSLANTLHTICGAIVILTFPIVASIITGILWRKAGWQRAKTRLLGMTILTWLSLFAFFGAIIGARIVNPDAGRVGPEVLLGWPNRIMVLVYHLWGILLALRLRQITEQGDSN
jgi:hypothetical protein